MLVLSRKKGESIVIGDNVVVTIIDIRGDKIRIGIEAPMDVPVHRLEVYQALQEHAIQQTAAQAGKPAQS
ncbi:MAG: carbon storage regulator CsrA [Pirellulaceae bacterium]|jgi:carbon storage regulator|nr:carbon storage regulator CsrA [Pirellulaceae bacterium]